MNNQMVEPERTRIPVRVLVVEDDDRQRNFLVDALKNRQNFADYSISEIIEADSADLAIRILESNSFDLILLDFCLEDGVDESKSVNGDELCRIARSKGFTCPILILSGKRIVPSDVVGGLESGANDYLLKPYSIAELLARIEKELQAHEKSEDAVYAIGPFEFRPGKNWLERPSSRKILLTEKESGILKFLYRARGQVVDKGTLLSEVWNYNPAVTTHTLETHIYRLRQKIEADPRNPKFIVTNSGGYRLLT